MRLQKSQLRTCCNFFQHCDNVQKHSQWLQYLSEGGPLVHFSSALLRLHQLEFNLNISQTAKADNCHLLQLHASADYYCVVLHYKLHDITTLIRTLLCKNYSGFALQAELQYVANMSCTGFYYYTKGMKNKAVMEFDELELETMKGYNDFIKPYHNSIIHIEMVQLFSSSVTQEKV